jgi:putative exosortase-associated protein (TIGR04073 family)
MQSMQAALFSILCAGMLIVAPGSPCLAQENGLSTKEETPSALHLSASKLGRGMANLGMGWMEFPKQIYVVGKEEGWFLGLTRGPVDGLGMTLARTVAGIYEVFTFPIPIPPHYQPLIQPPYVWQPDPAAEEREAQTVR